MPPPLMRGESLLKNCAQPASSLTAMLLAACLTVLSSEGLSQTPVVLVTTGSTMPESLYVLWGDEYHKLHPETQLRYLPVGTSESVNGILSGSGDLGGGDAPIPDQQAKNAARTALELPTVLVGIAIFYNLPGTATTLRLSGPVLANIYVGKTTSWSDQEIAKLNPEAKLSMICRSRCCTAQTEKGRTTFFRIFFQKSVRNSEPRSVRAFPPNGLWEVLSVDVRICWRISPRRRAPLVMPSSAVQRNPRYPSRQFVTLLESL